MYHICDQRLKRICVPKYLTDILQNNTFVRIRILFFYWRTEDKAEATQLVHIQYIVLDLTRKTALRNLH